MDYYIVYSVAIRLKLNSWLYIRSILAWKYFERNSLRPLISWLRLSHRHMLIWVLSLVVLSLLCIVNLILNEIQLCLNKFLHLIMESILAIISLSNVRIILLRPVIIWLLGIATIDISISIACLSHNLYLIVWYTLGNILVVNLVVLELVLKLSRKHWV